MFSSDLVIDISSRTFQAFFEEMQLEDPLFNKFKWSSLTGTTYARGSRRIASIFVDSTILPAIKRIGTLGLYGGIISDHVMLYMDSNEQLLFGGIINCPVMNPSESLCSNMRINVKNFSKKSNLWRKQRGSRTESLNSCTILRLMDQAIPIVTDIISSTLK